MTLVFFVLIDQFHNLGAKMVCIIKKRNSSFYIIGCILAELYTGYPIFPGENEIEQLACIMEVLDTPPENVIGHASRKRLFFGLFTIFVCVCLLAIIVRDTQS